MESISLRFFIVITLAGGFNSCTTPTRKDSRAEMGVTELHPQAGQESRATAERELLRREQAMRDATQLIREGDRMRSQGEHEGAIHAYEKSLDQLPPR